MFAFDYKGTIYHARVPTVDAEHTVPINVTCGGHFVLFHAVLVDDRITHIKIPTREYQFQTVTASPARRYKIIIAAASVIMVPSAALIAYSAIKKEMLGIVLGALIFLGAAGTLYVTIMISVRIRRISN